MRFETHPISELIDEISMGPFGSNIKVECFVDEGIPVLNGSNLEGYELKEDSFRYVTKEKADSLNKANAYRGDIVITHRGTLGQIVFIPQTSKYDRYVISQSQFRVRCNHMILPEYMVYYFHTRLGKHKLLSNASQVGVPALARPSTTFQKIEIEIPDIPTQKRIIAILQTIHDKIAINTKINENLEQQAQAIFKSWFVDYEPFGGIMPDDWYVSTLGKVSDMSAGGDKPNNATQTVTAENTIPIYSNGIANEGLYGFTDIAKIQDESVTVSARGTIGYVCLRQTPYVPIVRLVTLVPKKNLISAKYLYHWLKLLHIVGTGTTQQQLTVPSFKKTEIIIPAYSIMERFTNTVNPLYECVLANKSENQHLDSLRDTLLPKLMSGEIDVSEVQV